MAAKKTVPAEPKTYDAWVKQAETILGPWIPREINGEDHLVRLDVAGRIRLGVTFTEDGNHAHWGFRVPGAKTWDPKSVALPLSDGDDPLANARKAADSFATSRKFTLLAE